MRSPAHSGVPKFGAHILGCGVGGSSARGDANGPRSSNRTSYRAIPDQTRQLAHQLRLFGIHAHLERRAAEALASQMHPLEFLRLLLEDEVLFRKDRVAKILATRARFRSAAEIADWYLRSSTWPTGPVSSRTRCPPRRTNRARVRVPAVRSRALNGAMRQAGVVWSHLLDALRNAEIGYAERVFKGYAYPPPKHPLF